MMTKKRKSNIDSGGPCTFFHKFLFNIQLLYNTRMNKDLPLNLIPTPLDQNSKSIKNTKHKKENSIFVKFFLYSELLFRNFFVHSRPYSFKRTTNPLGCAPSLRSMSKNPKIAKKTRCT